MSQKNSHSDLVSSNKRRSLGFSDWIHDVEIEGTHQVKLLVESLKQLGFDIKDLNMAYLPGADISHCILSVDYFSINRSLSVEFYFDVVDSDLTIFCKTYRTHTKSNNCIVDQSSFDMISHFGPYQNLQKMFEDAELYENLRRLSHQIEFNKKI